VEKTGVKNAERNKVFSLQMFQRHGDRFHVIVRLLKSLGDRYYIYMLFNYKDILLSTIRFLSNFVYADSRLSFHIARLIMY
jgi:hypothetical protein